VGIETAVNGDGISSEYYTRIADAVDTVCADPAG
jgi:hypothetical protein